MKNLPMELLRAFVCVAQLGSFTKAGEILGRSQPAVSLQIQRLEELVDETLFTRKFCHSMTWQSASYLKVRFQGKYAWAYPVNLPPYYCQKLSAALPAPIPMSPWK